MDDHLPPIETHPLQPFLPSNGRILMLGSFPPQKKRWKIDFFYPNFNNDMWRVMGTIFYDDPLHFVDSVAKTYRKEAIIDFLSRAGIGLFDTASEVRRLQDNASDKFLEIVTPTDIAALLTQMPHCRTLATTGQKATDTLCDLLSIAEPPLGHYTEFQHAGHPFRLYRMPSTSRAYPLPLTKKAEAYRKMFHEIGLL